MASVTTIYDNDALTINGTSACIRQHCLAQPAEAQDISLLASIPEISQYELLICGDFISVIDCA